MGVSEVIMLKKNIRIKKDLISDNQMINVNDIKNLMRWCASIYQDSEKLLEEWKDKRK